MNMIKKYAKNKIMVTSLGDFGKAYAIIGADSVELTTDGIPGVYLCMED